MEEVDMDTEAQDCELVSRTSYLLRLYEKRNRLQQTLRQYEVKVKALHGVSNEPVESSVDDLNKRISDLNEKLFDVSQKKFLRDTITKELQLSSTLYNELFPQQPSTDSSAVKSSVMTANELASSILRIHQELSTLQQTASQLSNDNRDTMRQCQQLARDIQQRRQQRQRRQQHTNDPDVARVNEETTGHINSLHVVQNCLLGLIQASKVDWTSDPDLCQLVCELGQPLPQPLDST